MKTKSNFVQIQGQIESEVIYKYHQRLRYDPSLFICSSSWDFIYIYPDITRIRYFYLILEHPTGLGNAAEYV